VGRHVPAHRWAAAARGALSGDAVAAMERHASSCDRCASARERVEQARAGFAEIRDSEPPRMNWEHIGARIYWVTSSERRKSQAHRTARAPRLPRRWLVVAVGVAGVVFGIGALELWRSGSGSGDAPAVAEPEAPADQPGVLTVELITPPEAPADPLTGLVTFRQGAVSVAAEELSFDRPLVAGDRLTTGTDGRVTVQFGQASGFTLEPGSSLTLRSFDSRRIELALDGRITVDVEKRPADQELLVVAGDHTVAVRGTAFSVDHAGGELAVACARGEVAVVGPRGERTVAAGEALHLPVGSLLASRDVEPLSAVAGHVIEAEVATRLLPAWTDADALAATSSTLALAAPAGRAVKVDGEEIGAGSFRVRVMSGRHHVEADGAPGRWLRVAPGERVDSEAVRARRPRPTAGADKLRRAQLDKALRRGARVRPCLRSLEKQGLLDGSFIELDVGINSDGSLGHLNVVGTNIPRQAASCARSVVDAARLPSGPSANLRYRIAF
jgi:ferric-dicitrate binding protein FerR (iron transport regulator)